MKLVKILRIAALSCVSLIGMSQAASAEPISIAIVTALGIAGGTTLFATAVAVTNFALGLAVNFGLSLLSGALAKKPKQQGGSQTQVQYSADSYRIVPFGTVAIAGREVYWKGVGKKNKTNCYVIQLADWQCHQLRAVWVNGVRKTLTPVAVVGTEAARYEVQSFGAKFIVKWFPGTTTQTADSELITMSADTAGGSIGGWTADHIGKGVCYVSFIIEYDEELMPARPQLLWEIDGALLYDWRKDSTNGGSGAHRWDDPATWEFSSNPAVCDYNWCRGFWRNGVLLAGIGAASYDMLHSAYTTAANICDETLDDGGGSRKRYVVSVIINADGEHRIAREAFIAAMAGDGVERGGQFAVLAGAAYSPVMTLTDDDMAAAHSFKFQQKSPLSEIYNAVHVSWLNLDQPWSAHTLTPLTDAQYEDQDGGQRIARDIDLAMVPNPYQARAIGRVVLEQSRMQAIHTGVYGGKTAVLEPGDWVTRQFNRDTGFGVSSFLDTDPYGFDASALTDSYLNRMGTDELTMKVVSKRRAGPELYELTLRQCAVANFTAPAGPITVAGQPVVTPPVYTPATPGTPALVETVSINADGAAVSTITATWTASADAASYVISIKEGSADWVERRLGNVLIYSFRGRTGVTYQARVRAIDNSDLQSLWSGTASILVTGDTTAPAAPSGLSAAGMLGRIVLSWTNPGDGDLAGTEIWEAATDNFASATLIHTTAAPDQMWVRDNLGTAVTRYYWIKARDRTGNVSARYPAGGGVSGTTTKLDGGDVDTSPPSVPTGLAITSTASITPDGTTIVKMTASWNKVADTDLGYYEIGLLESGGNEVIFQAGASGSATERFEWPSVKPNTLYTLRIRALDIFSNKSAFSSTVNHTTAKDAVAPATPTGLAAQSSFKSIWLTWAANTETDLAGYEVYRHTASTPAPNAGSTPTFPLTGATTMVDNIGSGGAQRWYWIRAVDLSGNKSAWTASVNATTASIDPGDLGSTAPSVPATPSLASSTAIAPDGTSVTKITVTLTAASGAVAYELGVTEGAGAEVFYLTGDLKFDFPARPGVLYSVRAKSVNSIGNKSAWSSAATNTPAGDTTAPATPTGLSATAGFESVWLQWTANSEADLLEYDVYTLGTAAPAPGAGTAASFKTRATSLLVQNLTPGVIRYYWIRAVDTSGNKSAWTASVNATPVKIESGDIADGAVGTASFASGLVPVEIVATLPVSGNFAGRMVFLTSDNKLYRHNGTAFVATVPAADVTGQITTTQITDDAISTPKLAAGAVVTAKLAAEAVTANELAANSVVSGKIQAGAVAANELAAGSVIASKLAVTDLTNLIQDPLFGDTNYWGSTAGWSFQTNPAGPGDDFDAATALGAATVLKTPTGNGTTSQSVTALAIASGQRGSVEGGKVYRLSAKGYVTAGFTGRLRLQATWYAADNVTTVGTSNVFGIDYTSSAAGAATSEVLEGQATAPANAVFLRFRFVIGWSSTLNNAGTGYFAFPFVNRAASGKLIVDGSIEALHLSTGELITNTAQIKDAIISEAKISGTLSAAKLTAGTALANSITVNGTALSTVASNAADGSTAFTNTAQYRSTGAPSNNPVPTGTTISTTQNSNGSVNLRLDWDAYTQGALRADFLFIFWRKDGSAPTINDASIAVNVNSAPSYYVFEGVNPADTYSFGIAAGRRTENGLEIGAIQAPTASPDWRGVTGGTPNFTANVAGTVASTVVSNAALGAQDPGTRINAGSTVIDPGKIQVSGGTTLADWRHGGDLTKIDGGDIAANTITANLVTVGLRNIAAEGLEFEHNSPSANSVAWSSGTIRYTNDSGSLVTAAISPDNAAWTTGVLYIYWVQGATTLSSTTTAATAFGANNVVLAVYKGNTDLVTDYGRTIIDGSKIKTGTVEAAAIKAGAITTDRLVVGDFTNQADNWDFNQETLGWTLGTGWLHLKSDSAGCVYPPYRLQRPATASPSVASQNRLIPVVPGDNWFAEVFAKKSTGSGGGNIQAELLDGTGAVVRTVSGNVVTGTSWTTSSLNLTVGATEVALRLGIYAANTTGFFNADGIRLIRMAGTALIADAAIINAKIANAAIDDAKVSALSAAKLTAGTALAGSITVSGTALSAVETNAALGAQDPGTRINAGSTQIDPGKVLISGGTSLADWRKGGDETKIDGGDISANTIQANAVTIGLRGLTIEGLEFAHNSPSSNRVSWTAGTIRYTDNSGALVTAAISGSDVAWSTGVLYVYWVQGATALSTTTNATTAHGANNVVLAAYQGGTNLVANYGRTIIDGSKITTGTVDTVQLKANAVTSDKITAGSITASKLLIADFTNSVINSDFGGNTADGWLNGSGGATLIAVTPRGGASEPLMSAPTDYVAAVGSGAQATQCGVFKMPCKGGEEYYVEVMVAGASGSTKTAYLAAHWYTLASGSSTQINITGTGFVPGTSWSTLSGTLTIPAGATAVSIGVRHDNAAGPIYFTKLRVIRRASADLVVDGAITAVKMNVTSLSAIQANMGTLTAGKILGSNGFEIDATNERITSSNFVDGKAGFRLDGVSGSVKAYSGEFAGGTSSKLPFEAKFGLIQDGVLSDEGLASVRLPTSLTGSTDISLSGTAKRTPTGFEYDITAERVSSSAKSYIQGSFSRTKGITCPPAVCYTDTDAATVYFAYINSLGEIYTARMAHGTIGYDVAPTNVTLVGNLINSIDSDPMFEGVYASTVVHIWKSVLIKGIRRIRVPATVTVSGVPTAVVKARVWMWGAAGQANKAVRGGPGGYVKFDHAVDPGEILSLLVGGYDGDGFGGCSSVAGVTSAPDVLDGQGGGGSFLWRGPTLRANLLGVAGGGGGGPGDARNTGLKIGGPGGSTAFGGGNGVSGSAMDVCVGKSTQSGAPKGSGGGGYVGGGNFTGIGYPGKGGTNYVIGTATSVTNSASAEDGSGYSTTTTPPGTGVSVYTANQSYTWGRANVGVATTTQAKAGPGMIAIQWLTS